MGDEGRMMTVSTLPTTRCMFDHSKVFRVAYPDQLYANWRSRAQAWRELEADSGGKSYTDRRVVIGRAERSRRERPTMLFAARSRSELLDSAEGHALPAIQPALSVCRHDPNGANLRRHAGHALEWRGNAAFS